MLRRMKREHHEKLEAERTRRAGSLKGWQILCGLADRVGTIIIKGDKRYDNHR